MDMDKVAEILGPMFADIAADGDVALAALGLSADAAILDVGTGSGNFAIFLADRGFWVLTGEPADDTSQYAGRAWDENARKLGVEDRIGFQAFDAGDMPFEPGRFDAVFLFGVLHHVAEDAREQVFRETLRVAGDDGAVVFFEPRPETLVRIREKEPDHPEQAVPSLYAPANAVREQRIEGTLMDIFIYTKAA